ncbi:MAG: hypothetical protein JOZ69_04870 [Myxococcales bacterium]|nr:hypothetical protein [Myxococcales bacterium]
MARKTKAAKKARARERREQRFEPRPSATPLAIYVIGGIGAFAMGAGVWGEFGSLLREGGPEPFKFAPYVLALGAVLIGVGIWIGTSGEPSLRVGDAGLAVERAGLRRMPWYAVESVALADGAVRVTGKEEAGGAMLVVASLKSHPRAAAWIVKEARERVPAVVDVADAALPEPGGAGEMLPLEPPQIVGKHCAASGKVIAYEPDGRVCPRCERVYHKLHVPESCACGASLEQFRAQTQAG